MKILFVTDNYIPHIGGREKVVESLAEGMTKHGHTFTIITSRFDSSLPKEEHTKNVHIYRIWVPNFASRFFFFFTCIPKLLKEVPKTDLVHTHLYIETFPAWLIARLLKKPVILTVYEIGGNMWTKMQRTFRPFYYLFKWYERFLIWLPFDMIASSSFNTYNALRIMTRHPDRKLAMIYNTIDHKFWDPKRYKRKDISGLRKKHKLSRKWVYLFYGRPGVTKGLEVLLQAVRQIKKEIPRSIAFLIVSHQENHEMERIRHFIKANRLKSSIVMIDSVEQGELPNYLLMADCVVIPSLTEGFGYTAAETCALQRPIVASRVSSLPEVVSGKVNFFDVGDSDDLARAVIDSYNDKHERIARKKFTKKAFIENYLHIYDKVTKEK